MAMKNGARTFVSFFLGAVVLMLTLGSRSSCTNDKGALFETDVYGSSGDILKKCSAEKTTAFRTYLESFDRVGKGIMPYAPAFDAQPDWDDASNAAKDILEGWMKRKKRDLQAVFAVIEAAPVVPTTCSFERAPAPFVPGVERQAFAPVAFWILRAGTRSRHLVGPDEVNLTSYGSTSLLGDSAGYDVEYTKAASTANNFKESCVKEYLFRKCIDVLVITCEFKKDGATYTLQMTWNVPAVVLKDQRSSREYLKIMGPGFYAFDVDSGRTAFFRRSVENLPTARPLIDW